MYIETLRRFSIKQLLDDFLCVLCMGMVSQQPTTVATSPQELSYTEKHSNVLCWINSEYTPKKYSLLWSISNSFIHYIALCNDDAYDDSELFQKVDH